MSFDAVFGGSPMDQVAAGSSTGLGIDKSTGTLYANVGKGWQVAIASASGGGGVLGKVALAPSGGGNFTVAHGLSKTPSAVAIQMTSGGQIWLQSPTGFDATNIYAVASGSSVTGTAICFA